MRLRNIKGADERILADPYTIQTDGTDGADFKGRWNREYFHNDHPITYNFQKKLHPGTV